MSFERGSSARRRNSPIPPKPTPPRTVFKYHGITEYSLQALATHSIYFGSPLQFNDPFDCAITARIVEPTSDGLEVMRRAYVEETKDRPIISSKLEAYTQDELRDLLTRSTIGTLEAERERFLKTNGACCFAERNDDLLMWAHYGGSYRGFCLEFRTDYDPFDMFKKVRYVDALPEINLLPIVVDGDAQQFIDMYFIKSSVWGYEREWRIIHHEARTSYRYSIHALKAVYFGPIIAQGDLDKVRLAGMNANPNATYWRGIKSEREFKLEFEQIQ
jgi:hypothetical protein